MAKKESNKMDLLRILTLVNFVVIILVALSIVHLSKNVKTVENNQKSNLPQITNVSYTCDDNKTINATYFNNTVELTLDNNRNLLLTQGISASGVRYTNPDETITFWSKGDTSFLEEGPEQTATYNNCIETKSN